MAKLIALCAILLPVFAVTGRASSLGDSDGISSEIDIDLGLNLGNAKVAAGWWASWHSSILPLDKVSWNKYTHMTYAFA